MSLLLPQLEELTRWIAQQFASYEAYDEGHAFPWENYLWRSNTFRRAHLDVVDAQETKKLYMLHLTVFPHTNDPSPIFGLDIIAGPNKVTGMFHDFSPVSGGTPLDRLFAGTVQGTQWSKQRTLPDWARAIFSSNMVAAGNVQDPNELAALIALAKANLQAYLAGVGRRSDVDVSHVQNVYCRHQKQNPHTPRVMESLGFEPEVVNAFISDCLFPEI